MKNVLPGSPRPPYLYVLRHIHGQDAFFRWDVLLKPKSVAFVQYPAERTQEDFHRLVDLFKAAQTLIDSGNFIPNEGSHFCGGCGFQNACRGWEYQPDPSLARDLRFATLRT